MGFLPSGMTGEPAFSSFSSSFLETGSRISQAVLELTHYSEDDFELLILVSS